MHTVVHVHCKCMHIFDFAQGLAVVAWVTCYSTDCYSLQCTSFFLCSFLSLLASCLLIFASSVSHSSSSISPCVCVWGEGGGGSAYYTLANLHTNYMYTYSVYVLKCKNYTL